MPIQGEPVLISYSPSQPNNCVFIHDFPNNKVISLLLDGMILKANLLRNNTILDGEIKEITYEPNNLKDKYTGENIFYINFTIRLLDKDMNLSISQYVKASMVPKIGDIVPIMIDNGQTTKALIYFRDVALNINLQEYM